MSKRLPVLMQLSLNTISNQEEKTLAAALQGLLLSKVIIDEVVPFAGARDSIVIQGRHRFNRQLASFDIVVAKRKGRWVVC
ncbi:MAG: hypothetical protein HOM11_06875 [Methylococcales bacterium]|nr:hypothetical protein [Methylococcales bacterium]MBT7442898.1 hypothetical protein [Methylococcales bacterium]